MDRHASEAMFEDVRRNVAIDLLSGLAAFQTEEHRKSLAIERASIMEDFASLAQRRFSAGDLNQVDADLATIASIDAQIQRATAAGKLAEATQEVRSINSNSNADQWPVIRSELPLIANVPDPEVFVVDLPEIRAARRDLDTANATIEMRESERKPDPTLSIRGGREDDSSLVGVNLSIPLYIRNRFNFEVSVAIAQRDQAQQVLNDQVRRASARLLSASERYQISRKAWDSWQQVGQASLQRQVELLQRLWESGELSTTDFLVQIRQTLDTRENALDLELTMWNSWFEWLAASGQVYAWLGQEKSP